ncbi:MAG: polyphosphate kinase 1, partial [Planctomycetes bacterium]|nr:polyphosphate kinase 1 [Planctomycetota bacterium]
MIRAEVKVLCPGRRRKSGGPFRVTRGSGRWVDEEEVDHLLRALEGELPHRHFGRAVRLEVNGECEADVAQFLLEQFGLDDADLQRMDGPVNLHRFSTLHDQVDRPDLKYPVFTPRVPRRFQPSERIVDAIREGDLLLHHPFESFQPVIDLLKQSAVDPDVLAIKMTVYRSGATSPITDALALAARQGKEVTAVVELRARFDEAENIDIAHRLQAAGAKVVYGVVGYKAHAKMILIVRREATGIRRYVHLGTGNYHPGTTRAYTDWGLMTDAPDFGQDVHDLFQQLTGLGKAQTMRKLLQSPFTLHEALLSKIEAEAVAAGKGKKAFIRAKCNALTEPAIIRALYHASQAGVPIDLVVRGVCNLRPGVRGLSKTIRVRSIIGRFLEHTRVFHFCAQETDEVWLSSADWMPRNLLHRVEAAFPIESGALKQRVLREGLDHYFEDNQQAWELGPKGEYTRVLRKKHDERLVAQERLLD